MATYFFLILSQTDAMLDSLSLSLALSRSDSSDHNSHTAENNIIDMKKKTGYQIQMLWNKTLKQCVITIAF